MEIGQRIAELRKKQGMTQEQLADILGTTRQAVSKWESGKSTPDLYYAIAMGRHFGVSMDYLLLGSEEKAPVTEEAPGRPKSKKVFIVLLAFGVFLCLLLPLMAEVYRNYIFQCKGVAYTDADLYLREWPLAGVTFLAWGSALTGIGGLVWPKYKEYKDKCL